MITTGERAARSGGTVQLVGARLGALISGPNGPCGDRSERGRSPDRKGDDGTCDARRRRDRP